ncbi:MAG: glycosyltransferase family 39 protein [Gemmataceae bacterium]
MTRLAVVALLAAHAGLLLAESRVNFAVVDESAHIPAGLAHWLTGDFAPYRVNPPLPRMLAALPLLAVRPAYDWHRRADVPGVRCEWDLATDFSDANAGRYHDLICLARLTTVAWSLLGGWIVYRWAGEVYGHAAGLLSLALWCFEPNVLGHAFVVTPDVPATAAGLTASYAFWRYLRTPSWRRAVVCGVLLGVAELTKFTNLLLYLIWPLAALIVRPRSVRLSHAATVVGVSVLVINAVFGFRGTGMPLGDVPFVSRLFAGPPDGVPIYGAGSWGNRFVGTALADLPLPLPVDYLRGIDTQRRDFELCPWSYLRGEGRHGGWWYYYLYAWAVKLPLGTLGLLVLAAVSAVARPDRATGYLAIHAAVIVAVVSSQTGLNAHSRYVLPALPYLFVAAGRLAAWVRRATWLRGAVVIALAIASAASSLRAYPHHIGYFHELAGGLARGDDHLLESNVGWGQDMLFVKDWLNAHPEARSLGLACFLGVDPRVLGIDYVPPPKEPRPGWYAVDVNFIRGRPYTIPDGRGGKVRLDRDDYAYFQRFRPVAQLGTSMRIYRITASEADAVRRDLGLPPLP